MATIRLDDRFKGNPIKLPGVTLDPYRDLDTASGCSDQDDTLRQIGDKTREMQKKVLGVTIVTPGDLRNANPRSIKNGIDRMKSSGRVGEDDIFFVMGEQGRDLQIGTLRAIAQHGMLQSIGSFGDTITDRLAERQSEIGSLADKHLDVETSMIAQSGGLILETGAGADLLRLKRLQDRAKTLGSRLICHDVVPQAARTVHPNAPETPYLALPPRVEILEKVLADIGKPITITMQNVVSSMAFGAVDNLLDVAETIRADGIMTSQTLELADTSNMMPMGGNPEEKYIQDYLLSELHRRGLINGLMSGDLRTILPASIGIAQLKHTVHML